MGQLLLCLRIPPPHKELVILSLDGSGLPGAGTGNMPFPQFMPPGNARGHTHYLIFLTHHLASLAPAPFPYGRTFGLSMMLNSPPIWDYSHPT